MYIHVYRRLHMFRAACTVRRVAASESTIVSGYYSTIPPLCCAVTARPKIHPLQFDVVGLMLSGKHTLSVPHSMAWGCGACAALDPIPPTDSTAVWRMHSCRPNSCMWPTCKSPFKVCFVLYGLCSRASCGTDPTALWRKHICRPNSCT